MTTSQLVEMLDEDCLLEEMDAVIRVTWSDGSASRHVLCGLSCEDAAALVEVLSHKLADYLDEDWPVDEDGLPLGWRSVELVELTP